MIDKKLALRKLPSVLLPTSTRENWPQRQAEIIEVFREHVYGRAPEAPEKVEAETVAVRERDWAGKADHRELKLGFRTPGGYFSFPVHLVLPTGQEKLPLIIYLSFTPYPIGRYGPIEEIVDLGYGLATFCYQDVTADDADFSSGLAAMYPREGSNAWGKISLWAFAASRVLDYVLTLEQVDSRRVFSVGHSRLGKTSLWAAAQDQRFAAAVSNDSGCTGAAISRGKEGERIEDIVKRFPYWFCENYHQYAGKEDELPCDQHQLIASIAPRPVYIGSAVEDLWADPKSEFLGGVAASDAYRLLGLEGLVHHDKFPEVGDSFHRGEIGYHLREGTHFLSRYDWQQFLSFMDQKLG